jgi:hypothetical protein
MSEFNFMRFEVFMAVNISLIVLRFALMACGLEPGTSVLDEHKISTLNLEVVIFSEILVCTYFENEV